MKQANKVTGWLFTGLSALLTKFDRPVDKKNIIG